MPDSPLRLGSCSALALSIAASGCAGSAVFERTGSAISAEVAAAAYPRLAEVAPAPPEAGRAPGAPDQGRGEALASALAAEAVRAEARRRGLDGPVVSHDLAAAGARLRRRARRD